MKPNEKTPEELLKELGDFDFALVILDDKVDGCASFRTRKGLLDFLNKHSETGEKVDVISGTFDYKY